jgi:hypothetical protein
MNIAEWYEDKPPISRNHNWKSSTNENMTSTTTKSDACGNPSKTGQLEDQQRARRLEAVAKHCKRQLALFRRIYDRKAGYKEVAKGKCIECCGYVISEIRRCGITACPLWHKRPFQERAH